MSDKSDIKKLGKCQGCGSFAQATLTDNYGEDPPYILCQCCLLNLITNSLSSVQYNKILKAGHKADEFHLHDDFYDEEGNALQPKM